MIQIRKLTPPQITALREAFPACVERGILTTTNSIATFRPIDPGECSSPAVAAELAQPWTRERLTEVLAGRRGEDERLEKVYDKVCTRPEMVRLSGGEEVAA